MPTEPTNGDPETLDLEALGIDHMARHARAATFAPNWKSVLAADAFVGICIVILAVGAMQWVTWVGWIGVAVGVIYLAMVLRRGLQWRWLRNQAGL